MSHSVGIIGGADGPIVIFASGDPSALAVGIVVAAVILIGAAAMLKRK